MQNSKWIFIFALLLCVILLTVVWRTFDPVPTHVPTDKWIPIEMVYIPAGKFFMGSNDGHDDEKPKREVYLDAYEIAKYPLTHNQYKFFLDANPDHPEPRYWKNRTYPKGEPNVPVVHISWDDAIACAKWYGMRLPTEAEWEKAARGTDGRTYPWGNDFKPGISNTLEGRAGRTTPVDKYIKDVSPYGVMDMGGNVWEWCADWYAVDYYKQQHNRNPKGPKTGRYRVVRGGVWNANRGQARCADRHRLHPQGRPFSGGVRFARTP